MTHAARPATVSSGGSHHRSVRSVRALICARPADASAVVDTSGFPYLVREPSSAAELGGPRDPPPGGVCEILPSLRLLGAGSMFGSSANYRILLASNASTRGNPYV